jgi:hypothetical protein
VKLQGLISALGLAALLALLALPAGGLQRSSLAQEATSLSIDAIPEGNSDTSVAEIDDCASTQKGDTFDVDLIIEDVVDLLAWEINISYDPEILEVRDSDADMFQGANEGSVVQDLSESTPDDDGRYLLQSVDAADPISPDSGSGVLARLTFRAIGQGTSTLAADKLDLNEDGTPDRGALLRDVAGDIIGDEDGDTLFDGLVHGAEIRVGESCPDQAASTAVRLSEEGGGLNVALVVGLAVGGVAAVVLVVALAVFLRRRRGASP